MAERLKEWAVRKRIHPKTAYKMYAEGRMPVPTERFSERVILVHDPELEKSTNQITKEIIVYARVSSHDQVKDLDGQVSRVVQYLTKQGLAPTQIITEVGSGLNDNRSKYAKMIANPKNTIIVVEHRERLTRFGFKTIQSLLEAQDREIIVVDDNELDNDLVRDMTELLTSFAGRLYGSRSAKNRVQKTISAFHEEEE